MKKPTIFFASLLCLISLGACKLGPKLETLYSRSFVLAYYGVDGINVEFVKGGLDYIIRFNTTNYCDIKSKDSAKHTYDALCEKHGDVTYNREVRFSWEFADPRCATAFNELEITSAAAWDENHPAGSDLGNIMHFWSKTPLPYIRSGYTKRYTETNGGEYYPIDKLVSELTQDDMTLLSAYGFTLRFTHAPTVSRQHTLTFTLTDDEGVEYSTSIDVDFDALDPQ